MTDFKPIDPTGLSDRALKEAIASGLNAIHSCVDGMRAENAEAWARQEQVNAEAAEKRHKTANLIASVQGSVRSLAKRVGSLEADSTATKASVKRLGKMFGAEPVEKGEKPPKGRGIATWGGWKVAGAVFGALGGAVLAFQLVAPAAAAFAVTLYHSVMAHH